FSAYLYVVNEKVGLLMLFVLIVCFELFIEITGMVSKTFHPVMNILRKMGLVSKKEK
ncbi:MAG: undecaprenyl/decaprenyl-phosphate alpha-N-acetylglucosaminyl 1-phosphate transferase, partial [Erysipelotrichaceae bacterium]|nr:undecaprenyl/decaprenyl-phosphate alpha-N-acetylglucosaminyl 1-phosphate transferase [Erysipelotrichaceae bacterium]